MEPCHFINLTFYLTTKIILNQILQFLFALHHLINLSFHLTTKIFKIEFGIFRVLCHFVNLPFHLRTNFFLLNSADFAGAVSFCHADISSNHKNYSKSNLVVLIASCHFVNLPFQLSTKIFFTKLESL